ncbi:response regulator transcription factor [Gilvibacter sp.]|uniref:response regulator transcription factor n=1 Tax=Gilvibacter sp. TaxID=2729997 RepID=UPI003F4A45C6
MHNPDIAIAHSDVQYSRELFSELRLQSHYTDFRLANGLEALNYLINIRPEIMIIEANLPILNAIDLVKMANYKGIKTKFIILTKEEHSTDLSHWHPKECPVLIDQEDGIDQISEAINTSMAPSENTISWMAKAIGLDRK